MAPFTRQWLEPMSYQVNVAIELYDWCSCGYADKGSMSSELLGIQPYELRFTVEAKKQSSCSIQLINKTDMFVAFKVKTTSPKKYCVRPNVGIIGPNGTSDFTVTMQVQRAASLDLQCKDKFLVQSTVVPSGTVEEDLTSDMFSKDSGRHMEEKKLRVILMYSQSPVLVPANGVTNQDPSYDTSQKDKVPTGVENFPPSQKLASEAEEAKNIKPVEELKLTKGTDTILPDRTRGLETTDDREVKNVAARATPKSEMEDLLNKELEEYKSKLDVVESKLAEAEQTAVKLTDERTKAVQEKDMVKRELALVKRRLRGKTIHMGFPLLYICMVALICLTLGYLMQ
ncbi:hypothetical protein RND81_12G057300 [Saponaria officinalis]|uniref:MSP domain-containing protein n=2 Tax=Saponaria officinalis TaxID=3572 RepID=A0AAW1H6J0_SAPOF